jgi:hypothetical protein
MIQIGWRRRGNVSARSDRKRKVTTKETGQLLI